MKKELSYKNIIFDECECCGIHNNLSSFSNDIFTIKICYSCEGALEILMESAKKKFLQKLKEAR